MAAPPPRSVLIHGAGLAGCALGALLHDAGWRVTIVERLTQFERAGFTFTIQRSGWVALEQLGVADELRAQGLSVAWLEVRNHKGRRLKRVGDVGRVMADAVQLYRWQVNEALRRRADGCNFVLGTSVTGIELEGERVRVLGLPEGPSDFDLVVGADGIRSAVRTMLGMGEAVEHDTWTAYFHGPSRGGGITAQYGPLGYVLVVPTPGGGHWVFTGRGGAPRAADEEAVRAALRAGISGAGEDPSVVDDARVFRVHNLEVDAPRWSVGGRVVLVGDAAHGMWHTAGLGGSLAVRDATSLAAHLREKPMADALAAYEHERRPQAARALRMAHRAMGINLPPRGVGAVRNLLIRVVPTALLAPPQPE